MNKSFVNKHIFDVVIVGSGPAGVHAAYPLVKKGLQVAMIDGGLDSKVEDVFQKTDKILKIRSNIRINQSLAKGGLSEVWPGICDFFTPKELTDIGLPAEDMAREYKIIGKLVKLRVKPLLDNHSELILKATKYAYRLPITYLYRTSIVVDELKKYNNFQFIPNQLVRNVQDKKLFVEIQSLSINSESNSFFRSKILILAAGSLNTTRILLRSFNMYNHKTPFLTKSNYMFICLQPKIFFMKKSIHINTSQVAISNDNFFIQFYKCNPKSFEKAYSYIPLPKKLASFIFGIFAPFLVIADVRFSIIENEKRFLKLKKIKKGDILKISFKQTKEEILNQNLHLKKIKINLFKIGLFPLKMLTGNVTSHYANGVPIKDQPTRLSTDQNGKLHQTKRIYIADSSTWRTLPAKPPTLTIMTNASRIGKIVLRNFRPI